MIRIDLNSLEYSNNVSGVIYLSLESNHFPDFNWNDFPGVLLSWWRGEIIAYKNGSQSIKLMFMDGPYEVRIIRESENITNIEYLELKPDKRIILDSTKVETIPFINDLINDFNKAVNGLKNQCFRNGWMDKEVENLSTITDHS